MRLADRVGMMYKGYSRTLHGYKQPILESFAGVAQPCCSLGELFECTLYRLPFKLATLAISLYRILLFISSKQ